MNELGVGGAVEEFDCLRQLQQRRRREQHRIGHGDDGADRAAVIGMPIGIVVGGRRLLRAGVVGHDDAGLDRRCRMRDPVEMPERQHKLDRQRE